MKFEMRMDFHSKKYLGNARGNNKMTGKSENFFIGKGFNLLSGNLPSSIKNILHNNFLFTHRDKDLFIVF